MKRRGHREKQRLERKLREVRRCAWAKARREGGAETEVDALMRRYHDEEWGVPVRDERRLFEFLVLEGAQAGLSWATILRKREAYRRAFAGFDARKVARFSEKKMRGLLRDAGIVRNRLKIRAAVENARAMLRVKEREGSFVEYVWRFAPEVDAGRKERRGKGWKPAAETAESKAMSKQLRADGFRFVGPTICYAFMQAVGMVNDHAGECFRRNEVAGEWSGA